MRRVIAGMQSTAIGRALGQWRYQRQVGLGYRQQQDNALELLSVETAHREANASQIGKLLVQVLGRRDHVAKDWPKDAFVAVGKDGSRVNGAKHRAARSLWDLAGMGSSEQL